MSTVSSEMAHLVPADDARPSSTFVTPLLTDLYQITMTYAYWKAGKADQRATFELFFRKNPFKGEFTVFAGLEEVVRHVQCFSFSDEELAYVGSVLGPASDPGFLAYLRALDTSAVEIRAVPEGTVVFPRVPLLRVEGPLGVCQLLETTFLNLTNFASLMTTNAARFRRAAGPKVKLLEFGLRRAQGTDGGMSASRYACMGGFDGTSNVAAGMRYGLPVSGTHAHAFVSSFTGLSDLKSRALGPFEDAATLALELRRSIGFPRAHDGELAAFLSYAQSFPDGFVALVDTYNTLGSGVPNFCVVAALLHAAGHAPRGLRLDSGDLAHLSKEARKILVAAGATLASALTSGAMELPAAVEESRLSSLAEALPAVSIIASNDINEGVLTALAEQGHSIDAMGIGTHLVTCQKQPALGMVYKLVEVDGEPRIKLSEEVHKTTLPGKKTPVRLVAKDGVPLLDLLVPDTDPLPRPGQRVLCRHPFDERKRVGITPTVVIPLHALVWRGARFGATSAPDTAGAAATDEGAAGGGGRTRRTGEALGHRIAFVPLRETQAYVKAQLALIREDHLRPLNPTPYKVAVTPTLYDHVHRLWAESVPVPELS